MNFETVQIESVNEVKGCVFCASGLFDPNSIATSYSVLKSFCRGDIMAYCFRRFGYPRLAWDGDKQLCEWTVRTPMEGVFLTIAPSDCNPFGYGISKGLDELAFSELRNARDEWGRRFYEWAKSEHGVFVARPYDDYCTEDELQISWLGWLAETYDIDNIGDMNEEELAKVTPDSPSEFWAMKDNEYNSLANEYDKIDPRPSISGFTNRNDTLHYKAPFWLDMPNDSVVRQVNEALYHTINDLKRPVPVDGHNLYFDSDKCYSQKLGFASVSYTAGIGIDSI